MAFLTVFAIVISLGQISGWHVENGEIKAIHKEFYQKFSYVTEIIIFIVVPLVTLLFNIVVMKTAREATIQRRESAPSSYSQSTNENQVIQRKPSSKILPTTITLLAVSFYRVFTTAPLTIIYLFQYNVYGNPCLKTSEIAFDPTWQKFFKWLMFKKILDEIGISQYSCNIFIYIVTARHFRSELFRLVCLRTPCSDNDTTRKDFLTLNQSTALSVTRNTNENLV